MEYQWMEFCEKEIVLSTSTRFLNHFFFQEAGNDNKDNKYPCKVTLPNYKIIPENNGFKYVRLQRFISWILFLLSSSS